MPKRVVVWLVRSGGGATIEVVSPTTAAGVGSFFLNLDAIPNDNASILVLVWCRVRQRIGGRFFCWRVWILRAQMLGETRVQVRDLASIKQIE